MASLTMTVGELTSQLSSIGLEPDVPDIPGADILAKPLDIFRSHLANLIASAVQCDLDSAYGAIADSSIGDLEVIVPKLRLMDKSRPDPSDLPKSPFFSLPTTDGPRIRFYFISQALPRLLLPYVEDRKASYGQHVAQGLKDSSGTRKKVIVEFSSPNVGSEFRASNLRSTLLGAFVANIFECMGWDVYRLNWLGDCGQKLALLAIGFKRFGSEEDLKARPLEHMLEVYRRTEALIKPETEEIKKAKEDGRSTAELESQGLVAERDAFFRDLEAQTDDAMALWTKFRQLTIDHMKGSYERLGVRFDEYSGESQVKPETMAEAEEKLKADGFLEKNDEGSWFVDFSKYGKGLQAHTLRNHDGSSTYLLRDVGAAIDRYKQHNFDKMVYVVSARQTSHFQMLSVALKLLGYTELEGKVHHVSFGELQGLEGQMRGPLLLDNMLDQSISSIHTSSPEVDTDQLGPTAIAALVSKEVAAKKRSHNYALNPSHMVVDDESVALNLPQLLNDIVDKISELETPQVTSAIADPAVFKDDFTAELLGVLARYPEVTASAFKSLEPHAIFLYLSQLSDSLACLEPGDDEDEEEAGGSSSQAGPSSPPENPPETRRAQLELYRCARQVVENGMKLLGFSVADQ